MRRFATFTLILTGLVVGNTWADTVYEGHEDVTKFGTTNQLNTGASKASVDCGPTATVNSFQFLINTYGNAYSNLIDMNPNQTVKDLQTSAYMNVGTGGASADDIVAGKKNWISDRGLSSLLKVESLQNANANDTAQFIAQQLAWGQDVELGFLWSPGTGGHVITATDITFNATAGTGMISFIDPWGGDIGSPTPNATTVTNVGLTVVGGKLRLTYNTGAAAAGVTDDPDKTVPAQMGDIVLVAAESPVPLPSTVWTGMVLLGTAAVFMRHGLGSVRDAV